MPDTGGPADRDTGAARAASASSAGEDDFTDGRPKGSFASHYPVTAWLQIGVETLLLFLIAMLASLELVAVALSTPLAKAQFQFATSSQRADDNLWSAFRLWMTVFCAGVLGATTFSFKWLYHGVAWKEWHRDRIVWRLTVPLQGGMLAVFTGCMIIAGIVPLLSKETFNRLITAAGYGFMVGLFADNFLAALQKLAKRLLGTLGRTA